MIRAVIFDMFETLITQYGCSVYFGPQIAADAEIFRGCMKKLSVCAEECLYVGDGGSHELEAAQRLGTTAIRATWYAREEQNANFLQAKTPLDILKYLGTQ